MYKAVATGDAARAAMFAAMLARKGMEGPHKPFEGTGGWCEFVAGTRFSVGDLTKVSSLILDTRIKIRPAAGPAIASMLAAEKIAPVPLDEIKQVSVEVNRMAKERAATDANVWKLASREDADHSVPYLVAATLKHGLVTLKLFDEEHVRDPQLQELMDKTTVTENAEFTRAYERVPQQQRARVTVITRQGAQRVGESGGDGDDLSAPKSDAQIEEKFRSLTREHLREAHVQKILKTLWDLESVADVSVIPPLFDMRSPAT
jgi:2-methylcitrate dehydratase